MPHPAADTVPALMAAQAEVDIVGPEGTQSDHGGLVGHTGPKDVADSTRSSPGLECRPWPMERARRS